MAGIDDACRGIDRKAKATTLGVQPQGKGMPTRLCQRNVGSNHWQIREQKGVFGDLQGSVEL